MTKQEILAELTKSGEILNFRRTPTWEKAFEAYNKANPNDRKNPSCGHCFRAVSAWLKA
jgi:hypothetical protein